MSASELSRGCVEQNDRAAANRARELACRGDAPPAPPHRRSPLPFRARPINRPGRGKEIPPTIRSDELAVSMTLRRWRASAGSLRCEPGNQRSRSAHSQVSGSTAQRWQLGLG